LGNTCYNCFFKRLLPLNEFSLELIDNCLKLIVEYIKRIRKVDPEAKYCSINWDNLFPVGASILHSLIQVLIDKKPSNILRKLIKANISIGNA
jgi:galactose-1-phosphate uridylyltransferase